jgi:flagellar basal-body rod protein FlgB
MQLFDLTQRSLHAALHGAAVRQNALAANIANVDTPGYRRVDVDFQDALRRTLAGDARAVEALEVTPVPDMRAVAVRQDGNTVDIDREATEQATNGLTYQALVSVINAREAIIKSAIGVA